MAPSPLDPELVTLGRALEVLRRDRGLSQAEAGARLNLTSQGWGQYESGRRPGLFRPDKQRWLTQALDASPEDLALTASRLSVEPSASTPSSTGVESGSRPFKPAPDGARTLIDGLETLQLNTDELAPWAASGVVIDFNPALWPRRDQGCVIDCVDGARLVRLYDHADAERIWVRGGPNGLDTPTSILRSDAIRVSAITARREPS